jgi:hypothetical protein
LARPKLLVNPLCLLILVASQCRIKQVLLQKTAVQVTIDISSSCRKGFGIG